MENSYLSGKTPIADRFTLDSLSLEEFSSFGTTTWQATDTVLSRHLRAIVVDPKLTQRPQVIDAARRAALLDPAQHIAVVAIHDDAESAIIFTEIPTGERLKSYLEKGPLDPASTMAIMGQVAAGIHAAGDFGIRDLQLQARSIYLPDSGEVLIDGIGIRAALAQVDLQRSPLELDRAEARGLVIFLAALLQGEDFPEDPASHDSVLQKALSLPNLPAALFDLLQAEAHGQGPASAGDFLRRLAPWGEIDFTALPNPHARLHTAFPLLSAQDLPVSAQDFPAENNAPAPNPAAEVEEVESATPESEAYESLTPESATPDSIIQNSPSPNSGEGSEEALSENSRPPFVWPKLSSTLGKAASPATPSQLAPYTNTDLPENTKAQSSHNAEAATGSDASAHDSDASAHHENTGGRQDNTDTHNSDTNTRRRSRRLFWGALLAGIAIFAICLFALLRPLSPVSIPAEEDKNGAAGSSEAENFPQVAPQISSAKVVAEDPQTLETANSSTERLVKEITKAIDGDPETAWYTWWYQSNSIYNNDKIGVAVKLKEKTAPSEITVLVRGEGGSIKWMLPPSADAESGTLVSSSAISEKTHLQAKKPVVTDEFVLWIDSLPVDEEGMNRAVISEITVK